MEKEIIGFTMTTGGTKLNRRNVILKSRWTAVRCKFCGEQEKVVHYGRTSKGRQRYLCRGCKRTFLDNKAPERGQYPVEVIASALNQFYESASIPKIQRQLQLTYGVRPDDSTIYRWIVRYSKKATKVLSDVPIRTGSMWVADETVIKLKERDRPKQWVWDIIDDKTRFLLASHMSESRGTRDAQILMERASRRAGIVPKRVTTDKLAAYLDGIELAFGADTRHIAAKRLTSTDGTHIIERFHGILKDRTKVLRSFMRRETAKTVTDGWLCHYNFFRPHSAIGNKTPAEAARAVAPYKSWLDVVKKG